MSVAAALGMTVALPMACEPSGRDVSGGAAADDWIVLDPTIVIGDIEGDPNYLLGDVRSIALDDVGRIYVGDILGPPLRIYSNTGMFLKEMARGQGPGEVDFFPADLRFGPEGRLYVRDASRVTVFGPSEPDGVADSLMGTWPAPYRNVWTDRSHVGDDGTYYYPDQEFAFVPNDRIQTAEPPRFFFHVFRGGEETGDTVVVPFMLGMRGQRPAMYSLGGGTAAMVEGLSRVPFAPAPSWEMTADGTVLSADGTRPHLAETNQGGDTLRIIPLVRDSVRPVPPDERQDSLRALEARIDSIPVPLSEVRNLSVDVVDRNLPDVLPTVVAVHVGVDGRIWIERWPLDGDSGSRVYDVHDRSGGYLTTVVLRAPMVSQPPPYFGRRAVAGVVTDPRTGVHRVAVFQVEEW